MRLIIARHGNTFESDEIPRYVGSQSDLHLTDQGIEQAYQLAQFFSSQNIRPDLICSGNLQRQRHTAEILSKKLSQLNLLKETAFDEINYGVWEGLTQDVIEQQWPFEFKRWQQAMLWPKDIFIGSLEHHMYAIKKWLYHLQGTSYKNVIAVSSQGIIRCLLSFNPGLWQQIIEEEKASEYKVRTGHFCEFYLPSQGDIEIIQWNQAPKF